jgi:HD-GYP domain-containing protein (c-di-GMP phosphodiesterase class II)
MLFLHREDLNHYIMSPTVVRQIETIIEQIMAMPQMVLNMTSLKEAAGSFYERAINVTITSLCIGKKFQFSYDEIKQLATGALNYHIGLVALPRKIVCKDSPLTSEEETLYRQHTNYGYLLLAQNSQISPTSAIVALQHHEMQNGAGYPLGLRGSNAAPVKDISKTHVIHRFAEIVTVADTYHAISEQLTRAGLDEPAVTRETLKKCIAMGGESLNSEIVKALFSIVPVYPVGTRVRLTEAPSGKLKRYIGVVAKDNPDNLYRPVILLYRTMHGQKVDPPVMIDTSKAENIQFELYTGRQ